MTDALRTLPTIAVIVSISSGCASMYSDYRPPAGYAAPAASAYSDPLPTTPAPSFPATTDRVAWLAYCVAFETEIKRQAAAAGNSLQYQDSVKKLASYSDEAVVIFLGNGSVSETDAQKITAWHNQGERAAGKRIWDAAPLLDNPMLPGPSVRQVIIAARSRAASACNDVANTASAYHAQALAAYRRWKITPPAGTAPP